MCGILGGVTHAHFELQRVRDALDSIKHRGPDDAGWFIDHSVFLGNCRLSIIDTTGGKQPISNEDGNLVVVLNGEIYNYREIRSDLQAKGHVFHSQTDTEVLVHGYEEWGTRLLDRLRGMFAFALWDQHARSLFLARDRFGKKPLYLASSPRDGFFFASEIKALRTLCPDYANAWRIRPQSIYDYLSLTAVPQPHTVYEEVKLLPQGCFAVYQQNKLEVQKFWESPRPSPQRISYSEAMEQTRFHIKEAVRFRLRSDVPLGVFLSAGIDSSIIAYEASRECGANLETFTVAVDDHDLDESPIATRTAKALGVRNTLIRLDLNPLEVFEKIVAHFDQPFADASAIPSYAVSARAREFVTVALNGDGGDEVFGGYRRYVAAHLADTIPFLELASKLRAEGLLKRLSKKRRDMIGFLERLVRGVSDKPGSKYLTWTTDSLFERDKRPVWRGGDTVPTESWIDSLVPNELSQLRALMLRDHAILLPILLVKMDMASMLASLEARSPFLDHHLAEFAASLPDNYLVRGTRAKAILRDAYKGLLPDEVITAKKRGFEIPLERWLNTSLREILNDLLGQRSARVTDFIDHDFICKLLKGDILRERNRSYILYNLLVLELWLQKANRSAAMAASEPVLAA